MYRFSQHLEKLSHCQNSVSLWLGLSVSSCSLSLSLSTMGRKNQLVHSTWHKTSHWKFLLLLYYLFIHAISSICLIHFLHSNSKLWLNVFFKHVCFCLCKCLNYINFIKKCVCVCIYTHIDAYKYICIIYDVLVNVNCSVEKKKRREDLICMFYWFLCNSHIYHSWWVPTATDVMSLNAELVHNVQ